MSAPLPHTATLPADPNSPGYEVERIRADFPVLDQLVNGRPLTYLDNAATSQKPRQVLEAIQGFYGRDNANVHRGIHELSSRATAAYEGARVRVARFLGITDPAELIWTRGTTESLNLLAWSWGLANLRSGDEVLLTVMEHHSNLVPWQLVAARTGAKLRFIELDDQQRLDLRQLDDLLTPRTKLVSVAHISNAIGTVNPVRQIADRAHAVGALMVVDGAQSAPHLPLDISKLGCDFFAFSGHKMCGPTGVGGLWGRRELLEAMPPFLGGGDMIDHVDLESSTFAPLPLRFEAGTPNIAGVIGLGAAVDYLESLGRAAIQAHEHDLVAYGYQRLSEIPELRIFGPTDPHERAGVLSFTLADIHPHDLATILDAQGIAIRAGHHCTQPLMRQLNVSSTARASFYLYNTHAEVDHLVDGLNEARRVFGLVG
ncbi:MAG: cysteine desulfurase [Gemmatimonadota bacterium]